VSRTKAARTAPAAAWSTPRFGTVSPWASKATDIAHNCGLTVQRVERVTHYRLKLDKGWLSEAQPAARPKWPPWQSCCMTA